MTFHLEFFLVLACYDNTVFTVQTQLFRFFQNFQSSASNSNKYPPHSAPNNGPVRSSHLWPRIESMRSCSEGHRPPLIAAVMQADCLRDSAKSRSDGRENKSSRPIRPAIVITRSPKSRLQGVPVFGSNSSSAPLGRLSRTRAHCASIPSLWVSYRWQESQSSLPRETLFFLHLGQCLNAVPLAGWSISLSTFDN